MLHSYHASMKLLSLTFSKSNDNYFGIKSLDTQTKYVPHDGINMSKIIYILHIHTGSEAKQECLWIKDSSTLKI